MLILNMQLLDQGLIPQQFHEQERHVDEVMNPRLPTMFQPDDEVDLIWMQKTINTNL
jgi:hypothetical protein